MALLVTGVSAVFSSRLLLLRSEYGSTSIPELLERATIMGQRRRRGPDRGRRAGEERPGSAALLVAPGDGGPTPVSPTCTRRDGGRWRLLLSRLHPLLAPLPGCWMR